MTGTLDNRRAPGKGNTLYRPPNKRRPGGEEEGQGINSILAYPWPESNDSRFPRDREGNAIGTSLCKSAKIVSAEQLQVRYHRGRAFLGTAAHDTRQKGQNPVERRPMHRHE